MEGLDGQVGLLAEQIDEAAVVRLQQGSKRAANGHVLNPSSRVVVWVIAATNNAPGSVTIQLPSSLRTTPQRTAEARKLTPTPTRAPSMVWGLLPGAPGSDRAVTATAPASCSE